MLNRIFGGIFLIAGTSIGAGMLGLPIKLLGINYKLSISIFVLSWILILLSAFALIEISFWFKNKANIISIAKTFYGKNFSLLISLLYILFFYSLIIAYISGSYSILINTTNYKKIILYKFFFIIPFCIINFHGIKLIAYINKFFFSFNEFIFSFNLPNFKPQNIKC